VNGSTTDEVGQPAVDPGDSPAVTVLRVEVAGKSIWQAIGAVLATVLLLQAAVATRALLGMVALSFFFSLALDPAVRWLRRRYGWRRGAAVGVIYLLGVSFVGAMVFVLIPAIQTLADTITRRSGEWFGQLSA
jgi:predicted PurR-regulated permease PerM